jgi:hypothetical protein
VEEPGPDFNPNDSRLTSLVVLALPPALRPATPRGSGFKSDTTNLGRLTQQQYDRIAEQLNNRPRLRLGFKTPNEVYYHPSVALQI